VRDTVRLVHAPEPVVRHRVPSLLLAGVSHADAGVLSDDLGRHPQVCLPATRRIDHFTPLRYGLAVDAPLADYDTHFADWRGERYRLETSPVYFDGGPRLVADVAAAMPSAHVVLLLCDPAERLWTSYLDKVRRRRLPEAMPFDRFVDRCLALRANGADRFEGNRYYRTLSSGYYVEHLPRWADAFPGRVHVVFAEHVAADPEGELTALLGRLGLDAAELAPAPEREALPEPAPSPARPGLRRLWPGAPRHGRASRADAGGPRLTERQRDRARTLYAAANRELAGWLRARGARDLPGWLPDA
jgi:hypothetical protein